ncbi:hypothetical protein BOX15_Mlig000278g2 [Macrostomum lignano]|uniref:Ergosterol biosynthetic protein 28 n=2 Tax=Macrostomum lignano TaxID=282301 RepID=A0A267H4T1_9PLAT|nr:hypothetical protein BOX15_Mlig000278g2 [Macrostomum lignano]
MLKLLNFSDYLRGWIGAIGLISVINGAQAVWNPDLLARNVYTGNPQSVTRLASRQFALWTMFCGLVRLVFCANPDDSCIRLLTVTTFLMTLLHFLGEIYVWGTSVWTFGVISPCCIAGISLLLFAFESLTKGSRGSADDSLNDGEGGSRKMRLERMMMQSGAAPNRDSRKNL